MQHNGLTLASERKGPVSPPVGPEGAELAIGSPPALSPSLRQFEQTAKILPTRKTGWQD